MEAEGGMVISPDGSLASMDDTYDLAMAQMNAHMLDDGDDRHSLDAASGHSDEELRNIMEPESRVGSAPRLNHQEPRVTRSEASRQLRSGASRDARSGKAVPRTSGEREPQPSGKEYYKISRGRPRKSHEAMPFLSIDTMPTHREQKMPVTTREKSAGSQKGSQIVRKKIISSSKCQARAPPGTPAHPVFGVSRSRMGRSSSAISSEWNALVPRQKQIPPGALDNPVNKRIKDPFKHSVNKPDFEKAPRPMSPGQSMKERTAMATVQLARTMAKQKGDEEQRIGGRLLKGRLKPLCPVKLEGPTMQHCRGVVAEENPFLHNQSQTVARRRQIVAGMLTKDFLFERPATAQSLHHTSVAPDLSDRRERAVDQGFQIQKAINQSREELRIPPNSLASTMDASQQNVNHPGPACASALSSDVFEIDQIPSNPAITDPTPHNPQVDDDKPKMVESNSRQSSAGKRPNTEKAVRFADPNQDDAAPGETEAKGEEDEGKEGNKLVEEGCRSWSFMTTNEHDDDPDSDGHRGGGGVDGPKPGPGTSSATKPDQAASQQQKTGESNGTGNTEADCHDSPGEDDLKMLALCDVKHTDGKDSKMASYNTVLYTSQDVRFPRAGQAPRPKSRKGKKQTPLIKKRLPSGGSQDITDMALVVTETAEFTKDYYDQFARRSPPSKRSQLTNTAALPLQSASGRIVDGATSTGHVKQLRRPASAGVPNKGKEPKVQFVIKPNTSGVEQENGQVTEQDPRLNEMAISRPNSARTQDSGMPSTACGTGTLINPLGTSQRRMKPANPSTEFKVEGAKMSHGIKSGVCTECGKPTNKIADYWEETGALVCELCDRSTRAAETQKMEWLRERISQMFMEGEEDTGGEEETLAITNGVQEEGHVTSLEELERSLVAVRAEINQCVKESQIDIERMNAADEAEDADYDDDDDEDDKQYLALTSGDVKKTEEEIPLRPNGALNKQPNAPITGEISKILTKVEADPNALSEYEMKVYWYQDYCKSQLRSGSEGKNKTEGLSNSDKTEDVYDGLKRAMGHKSKSGEINVYRVKVMCDETKDPAQVLLEENGGSVSQMAHFKGERVSWVGNGGDDPGMENKRDLGVSGTAAKLTKTRPRSGKKQVLEAVAPFAPLCFRINARPPQGFLYYFAYGPDMNPDRMKSYIQRSVDDDRLWGLLYGFSLVFNKKGLDAEAGAFPNIELRAGSSTEGCLYLITLEELDKLDRHLGYPEHYEHAMLPVWLLNSTHTDEYGVAQYCVPALIFVAKDEWIHTGEKPLPNEYVVDQCMKGGSNILSPAYCEHLKGLRTVEVAC